MLNRKNHSAGCPRIWRAFCGISFAPLLLDLQRLGLAQDAKVVDQLGAEGGTIKSFADLLGHASPPLELLKAAKVFAKQADLQFDAPIPSPVARVLYYATIVVARLRCQARISELTDGELRLGLTWVVRQAWVDEAVRAVCREGLETLNAASK